MAQLPDNLLRAPTEAEFTDADGYTDWDAYDDALDYYIMRKDFEDFEASFIPDMRESWCGEPPATVQEDDCYLTALLKALEA